MTIIWSELEMIMLSVEKASVAALALRSTHPWTGQRCGEDRQLTLFDLPPATPPPGQRRTLEQLSEACDRMPKAVICLQSAAFVEGLVDEGPHRPWIALPQGSQASRNHEHWRFIRWSNTVAFHAGVIADRVSGISVRRTGPARTIVDLVRYARHFRSLDPGIRAARRFVAGGGRLDEVSAIADQLRIPVSAARSLELLLNALRDETR